MKQAILIIMFIFIPALAGTGFAGDRAVSLEEAIKTALSDNSRIKSSEWALKAAREQAGIADSYKLPQISFEERFMRTDNPTYAFMAKLNQSRFTASDFEINALNNPEAVNDFQSSIKLEQLIFSRRVMLASKMSRQEFSAATRDTDRIRETVIREVSAAYLNVLTARQFIDVADKGLEEAKEHRRLAQVRYDSGMGLYSDLLRTDAALKEAERMRVQADKNYQVAKKALGLTMGKTDSVDAMPINFSPPLAPLDSYYQNALGRNDLKAAEEREKNARNGVSLAKSGYLPEIGIGGQYQWNSEDSPVSSGGQSYMAQAFLRWSIFDGAKREHEVKQARARAEEAREGVEGFKKQIEFSVFQSYKDVEEARTALDLAIAEAASAEEGRRLVIVRFQNNLAPVVDLLDAQTMVLNARSRAVQAQNDLLDKNFKLSYESGEINDFIKNMSIQNLNKTGVPDGK